MVCLDTSFFVDYIRGRAEAQVFLESLIESGEEISITTPTVFELIQGASLDKSTVIEKKRILETVSYLNVLTLGLEESVLAGEIQASLILKGEQIGEIDVLIGAIARFNNQRIITKNTKHFSKISGLVVESY